MYGFIVESNYGDGPMGHKKKHKAKLNGLE